LTERHVTDDDRDTSALFGAFMAFHRGRWREARAGFELHEGRTTRTGLTNARVFAIISLAHLGELREMVRRTSRLCADAKDRGDLYTIVSLVPSAILGRLMDDDPEGARQEVGVAGWTQKGLHLPHWLLMVFAVNIDLYAGNAARAYDRFVKDMPRLEKSFLLRAAHVRTVTFFTRARLAIASLEAHRPHRAARIAEARRIARRLEREHVPWIQVLAAMAQAMAANAAGDRATAVAALRTAVARADETHFYGVPSRYRLGELLGGPEGRELVEQAREALSAQGVRNPDRWVAMLLPGRWEGPRADPNIVAPCDDLAE
jgi:hypothetical protein